MSRKKRVYEFPITEFNASGGRSKGLNKLKVNKG